MLDRRSLLLAGLAVAAPLPAFAQPTGPSGAAPPALTPADQALVDDFLAAANGEEAARTAFLATRVAGRPQMPAEEFAQILAAIARRGRGLRLVSATRRGETVRLLVAADNGAGRTGRVDLDVAAGEPGRLNGLLPVPVPRPYDGPKVTGPLSTAELAAAIDRRVRFAVERDDLSGAVLVMRGETVIYSGAFGMADKAAGKANTLQTRFNLGSMDKQFTAVAIGRLVERGRLSLDTRLIDVLPDYPHPQAGRKILIRHLLSHSAGLGMLFERPGWSWKLRYSRMAELLPLFASAPLAFEPGADSAYSNEGFVVLGAVVERITGESWYDHVQAVVFRPAGMTRTAHLSDDPSIPDRAVGYKFGPEDPLGMDARLPNWDNLSARGNSCGGGFSTAPDMIRFLSALRGGRLLGPSTLARFIAQAPGGRENYGLGFDRPSAASGRTLIGHGGGGPGSGVNSDAKVVWETGYAYAVLGNYDAPFAQTVGRDIGEMLAWQS